jgi:8-oxo-dGTP pyrophosphatase MutT (NUDIX family)
MATALPSFASSVIQAAGGILYRETSSGDEVMLVHRKRYGDWALPKGKLKPGESYTDAALREVEEETGCAVHLGEYLGAIGYQVKGVPKVVLFWRMSIVGQHGILDECEINEIAWMRTTDAAQRLTHFEERAFLLRVSSTSRTYQSPKELSLPPHSQRSWPPFQGKARSYARLLREFEVFRVELAFLEQRSFGKDRDWISATHDQLNNVKRYLEKEDVKVVGLAFTPHNVTRFSV